MTELSRVWSSATSAVSALLAKGRVPGCSAALVTESGVVWSGGFGWSDLGTHRRAEPGTVYHMFSGTKLFTATAILQLVERGMLSLDDSVASFLPELAAAPGITVRDLLSHRSGLGDSLRSFLAVTLPGTGLPDSRQALSRYRIHVQRPPRERVEYRNTNYAALGHLVTVASGVEYTEYVVENILRPLGMRSGFTVPDSDRQELATGYVDRFDPMRVILWMLFPELRRRLYRGKVDGYVALSEFSLATPAIGGLLGSVVDWGRFVHAHLTGGAPVLSTASTSLMQTLVAEGAAGIESRVGVGLGWKIGEVDGRRFLNHEGGGAGFTSELRIYPDARVGMAVAMNTMRMPATMRTAHVICESIFAHRDELMSVGGT